MLERVVMPVRERIATAGNAAAELRFREFAVIRKGAGLRRFRSPGRDPGYGFRV